MHVKKRKKIIRSISLVLTLFLAVCTMIASRNQRMRIPRVAVTVPQAGYVNGQQYDWVLPVSALYQLGDSWYAYHVDTMPGLFEDEQIISDVRFAVLNMDEQYVAVEEKPLDLLIVADSNQPLENGMRVMITGAGGVQ